MESHILNSFHHARFRTIGHKIMRAKSDSLSSDGSTNHSPEYAQIARPSQDSNGEDWGQNQTINTTQSSQDTSSDDDSSDGQDDTEENLVTAEKNDDEVVVQEINVDDDECIDVDDDSVPIEVPVKPNGFRSDSTMLEDTLVEGHDYDVITVYEVNPDLDLIEPSSDDDSNQQDFATEKVENFDDGDYLISEDALKYNDAKYSKSTTNAIYDAPVVSNVDEYFIKEKDILAVDGPVVKDVDEYFIKDKGKESTIIPNVDDFFIKHKLPEEESTKFRIIPENLPNVEEFLVIGNNIKKEQPKKPEVVPEIERTEVEQEPELENNADVSINESDLEVLPNIEELKRYLLEEMTYTKFKSIQRSCSLPQSPMQNICMDVDDAKTCLSFEDLNLDLSDLAFDSDKDKSDNANKSDDIPRTLTDEDVNSFLITNKPDPKMDKDDDDLNPQDMEIEHTIESNITVIRAEESFRSMTSTPLPTIIPTSKVLDFCVEKTPSPSKEQSRREKRTLSDSQATPKKVAVEAPLSAIIVPVDSKLNAAKVISVDPKPAAPVEKSSPAKPVIVKPVALKPVAVKSATAAKPMVAEPKVASSDLDDFVDVESCNDTVIPVLEANNLSSLLEQFEASEKLNKSKKPLRIAPVEEQKKLNKTLTNGMRIQDAGVQLKNNKMRQILMPTTVNSAVRRSPSPVHSDHDYCSSKKRHSLPNLKGGQSLLKPEVLSSNSRILNSRHRSCKNKKVVYNLSSDDESDKKDTKKKVTSDSELKKKTIKPAVKPPAQSNCRKKLSPRHSVSNDVVIDKSNSSVINKCASKASDTPCSQNTNGSIKLTIKNKSEVILNCDLKDSQNDKRNDNVDKCKVSSSVSDVTNVVSEIKQEKHIKEEKEKNYKEVDRIKNKHVNSEVAEPSASVKEETRPKDEKKDDNFYTALFSNKQDVKIPQSVPIKKEINAFEEELNKADEFKKEEPHKKKKLNLQEYKLRRGVSSNSSSTAVSPESIFPDMPHPLNSEKTVKPIHSLPNGIMVANKANEAPKTFYDPIREASRKIVANAKKQKAEALRKRDEDIVMSKIPKVDNLQLQPLISDAEMLKIVGMNQTPEPVPAPVEKPQLPADIDEIILVSVGTNTDENIFKDLLKADLKMIEKLKRKSPSPPVDPKSRINFKINKSETVLKHNVFDSIKKDKRDDKKHAETKIDKERFKDITATLKSVGKQVDTKISSNSLFASIQDVVMKKAPEDEEREKPDRRQSKPKSPVEKREVFKFGRPTIVRDYDTKAEHGEDKIILHLGKHRNRPISSSITIQTDTLTDITICKAKTIAKEKSSVNKRRNDSDMSMSSDTSPVRTRDVVKPKDRVEKRSLSKDKLSRSNERFEKYRRRSKSLSRSRRRRRSITRSRSRSRGRFRRYRRSDRSDSPYARKRRSRSRSRSYHKRRSPSVRRDRRSRSRSRQRTKSPVAKKAKPSPQKVEQKIKSMTPPLRKPTVSESSDSSTSSSSSATSSDSSGSGQSRRSCTPFKEELWKKNYRSFSSEDRENNTPVEERRIVFVGKLEKDITKATLRGQFSKFGQVLEVRLHSKEDGTRYGFVTYQRPRDAWSAVEAAATFPQYDVGFGGRRAFCRQSYADLDGLEAKYTESAFHGAGAPPARRTEDMSFEQMLLDMKKKLSQRKKDDPNP